MGLDMYLIKRKKGDKKDGSWCGEVAYWRKANHIHKWMVDNIQANNDDCGYYEIPKEKLEELKGICERVYESLKDSETMKKKIHTGWENGKATYAEIDVFIHTELAEELLPTQEGFFFGSTDYDEWYLDGLRETIDQITNILKETDFKKDYIVYTSSW